MTTNPDVLAEDLALDAELLRQLANASRLHVCYLLATAEHDVGTLAHKVGISQSALSQHLARLLQSGLVRVRRRSQNRYYRCNHPDVLKILTLLSESRSTARHFVEVELPK